MKLVERKIVLRTRMNAAARRLKEGGNETKSICVRYKWNVWWYSVGCKGGNNGRNV
jgi:hypothetical protein